MKKKFFLCFFVIVFILLICFIVIYLNSSSSTSNIISKSILSNGLSQYKDKSINILHYNDKYLYGSIESDSKDSILLTTLALFTYNTETHELNIINQENNKRIIDFYLIDNKIYYCNLSFYDEYSFSWKIYMNNLNFDSEELLIEGTIQNMFEYPRFFGNSENLFIILKDNNITQISQINNSSLTNIKTIDNERITMINMDSIMFHKNCIYYSSTSASGSDMITEISLDFNTDNKIYVATNNNNTIYNYSFLNDDLIIQEVVSESQSILIDLNINTKSIEKTLDTHFLTFARKLDENTILFHSTGNLWEKYNKDTNSITTINLNILNSSDIFPKYTVIKEDTILIQKFNNDFYVITL